MNTEPERRGFTVPPRYGPGPITTALNLGPLAFLPGSWRGTGFSVMWRPDNPESQPVGGDIKRFLQLNLTRETLDFRVIPGPVPNRGLAPQTDLELYGLHYLQRVSDDDPKPYENRGEALHLEPGLFMNVPASTNYPCDTIVRMGSIPHGVTVLMQGDEPSSTPVPGPPDIPPIYPIAGLPTFVPTLPPAGYGDYGLGIQPVDVLQPTPPNPLPTGYPEHIVPEVVIDNDNNSGSAPPGSMYTATEQSNSPITPVIPGGPGFPATFQDYINDPNQVLRDALAGQDILGTITINLATENVKQSIAQIPFLGNPADPQDVANTDNAFVYSATSTFWIEWVKAPGHYPYDHYPLSGVGWGDAQSALRDIEPYLGEATYLQLQYSQTVILIFNQVFWPHVTVATLALANG
jgi:hypothetical protein